jgi:hypothetical protein
VGNSGGNFAKISTKSTQNKISPTIPHENQSRCSGFFCVKNVKERTMQEENGSRIIKKDLPLRLFGLRVCQEPKVENHVCLSCPNGRAKKDAKKEQINSKTAVIY